MTEAVDISAAVLLRCQKGDAEAFAELVQTYERPLFSYVYRFTAGERGLPEPEDIVQEVFLRAWRALPRWDAGASVSVASWLFTIARNYLVDLLRRTRPELVASDELPEAKSVSRWPSPRDEAELGELHDQVAMAIANLPEKLRTAFLLRYHEERSYAEIAEVLACDVGTVKSRIARARAAMAENLHEYRTTKGVKS